MDLFVVDSSFFLMFVFGYAGEKEEVSIVMMYNKKNRFLCAFGSFVFFFHLSSIFSFFLFVTFFLILFSHILFSNLFPSLQTFIRTLRMKEKKVGADKTED